jgi:hypothetical protein
VSQNATELSGGFAGSRYALRALVAVTNTIAAARSATLIKRALFMVSPLASVRTTIRTSVDASTEGGLRAG